MPARTASFGAGQRESHDSSAYYGRGFLTAEESRDRTVSPAAATNEFFVQSSEKMHQLPDSSVALMVTSPPYHVRRLAPQRMPGIGCVMRREVIWWKATGAGGNCDLGSWRPTSTPVIQDIPEYCPCFSAGRFDGVVKGMATISANEFMESTLSRWEMSPEYATGITHPAPFPVTLPRRFTELYTCGEDLALTPCTGSGSTAAGAVRSSRRWVGDDINPDDAAATSAHVEAGVVDRVRRESPVSGGIGDE